ncbi:tyrosinase family oxidase copper chaperone [Streptomyces sp. CRN 30]|uniref:tyrosinase family oxidase copper chaperone n=1 Tax=Streptomyces sp. CRN 30 TaxID=3075613 RepID=UPI0039C427F4
MRALLVAAVALVLTPAVTASRLRHAAPPGEAGPLDDAAPPGAGAPTARDAQFDETYRGRRIRGVLTTGERAATAAAAPTARWRVTVDGRPLHLMRRADGTYLSMVDHYRSCPTALGATRAAVDEMGTAQRLRGTGAPGQGNGAGRRHGHHGGGGHGVHA